MLFSTLCLASWVIKSAYGFQDTSPFFYFSTADHDATLPNLPQIIRSESLLQLIKEPLSRCLSDTYILVTQPSVNAVDYEVVDATPRLRQLLHDGDGERTMRSAFEVPYVLGELDADKVEQHLHERCKAEIMNVDASTGGFQAVDDMKPRVVRVEFPSLPSVQPQRANQLRDNDAFLRSIIDMLPSTKYTVLYTTTPLPAGVIPIAHSTGHHSVPAASLENLHAELKRDLGPKDDEDNDQPDVTYVDGPLFARYQFLSPGLFMGLLVGFLLLGILGVGVSALGSLQVSYGAFEKEMGPAAQKKQQ